MGPLQRIREFEKLRKAAKLQVRAALQSHQQQIIAKMSPDELAKPLIKSNQAGWANVSR